MTYKIFLPYVCLGKDDPAWRWLCSTMRDKFSISGGEVVGNYLIFYEEEDMQLFILMWGEYL